MKTVKQHRIERVIYMKYIKESQDISDKQEEESEVKLKHDKRVNKLVKLIKEGDEDIFWATNSKVL